MKCILTTLLSLLLLSNTSAQIEGTFIGDTKGLGPYDDGDCYLEVPFFIYKVVLSNDGKYSSNIINKAHPLWDDEMIAKYCIYIKGEPYHAQEDIGTYSLDGDTITFTSTLNQKDIISVSKANYRNSTYTYIHITDHNQNIRRITINDSIEYNTYNRKVIPKEIIYPKKYLRKIKVEYITTTAYSSWTSKEFHINGETDIKVTYNPNHDILRYSLFEQEDLWRYNDTSISSMDFAFYRPEMFRVEE